MIERIELQNFGPFREASLEFGPLTVVVGPNSSGKTTLLKAVARMCVSPSQMPASWLAIGHFKGAEEAASAKMWANGKVFDWIEGDARGPDFEIDERNITPECVELQLEPNQLRQASYVASTSPQIHHDGYGLPTALMSMKLNDDDSFESVCNDLQRIVPTFEKLRIRRAPVKAEDGKEVFGEQLIFDMKNGEGLTPDQVSDGTILTLGILTGLWQRLASREESQSSICLIDEVERSLHPKAMGELVKQLRCLASRAGTQILATSHSPYLLDWLQPDEVRITGFMKDGSSTIRRLSEHPEFERWKDEMTPGEFWSTVGEDWVA